MDAASYFTHAFKWQLASDMNSKHHREELLKLMEEFPVPDEQYEKKRQALEEKYRFPDE